MVHELQCGINGDGTGGETQTTHDSSALHSFALAVLLPPANVERELTRLQQTLFADYALASAFALPPVLPIAAVSPDTDPGRFARSLERHRQAFRVEVGAVSLHGSSVLAEASMGTTGQTGLDAISRALGDPQPVLPPFPLLRGFWIAEFPAGATLPSALPDHAAPGFSSFQYGLMVVRCHTPGARWWERVSWEIRARVGTRRQPDSLRPPSARNSSGSGVDKRQGR
jgi:hypothetical protein